MVSFKGGGLVCLAVLLRFLRALTLSGAAANDIAGEPGAHVAQATILTLQLLQTLHHSRIARDQDDGRDVRLI
jgi:hypothetical protein